MAYASNTSVPVEKSRMEIERTLTKYGASSFAYYAEANRAAIKFVFNNRHIGFYLNLPDKSNKAFTHHSRGAKTAAAALASWEQACRQKWRALNLVIKAKLEAVDAGISTIEDEFLANTFMPNGQLFGEYSAPTIDEMYLSGQMPTTLLLGAPNA
jgi:hypothetical protein